MTWYRYSRVECQTAGEPASEVKGDRRGSYLGQKATGEMSYLLQGSYLGVENNRRGPTLGMEGNRRGSYLGVKADPGHPVSVTLPTHDEVPSGQVPHLPGLVITAGHLQATHDSQAMSSFDSQTNACPSWLSKRAQPSDTTKVYC